MSTICFYAQFTASRAGLDGLTVTWDVERITRADGTRSALVTGGANSIAVGRRGLYGYVLSSADLVTYDYIATAITTSTTADIKEVPAVWTLWAVSGTGTGGGSTTTPITINDGVNPLDGVDVWASTDSAGNNVVARGYTNASGIITFYLDPGTYYIFKTLAGYTFTNPSTLVVT